MVTLVVDEDDAAEEDDAQVEDEDKNEDENEDEDEDDAQVELLRPVPGEGKGSLGAGTISKYSDQRLKLYQRGSTFVPNSICDFSKVKYISRHFAQ